MATVSIVPRTPTPPVDHEALDLIMSALERRHGHEPRLDRAFRLFMAGRVEISEDDPTAALVHGDTDAVYWATATGMCECIDSERGNLCKHALATKIAVQMQAVANAEQAPRVTDDARAQLQKLCFERGALGARLCSQGLRPVDDPTWVEYGEWIAALRSRVTAR
jgi:hypothetical protein